MSRCKSCNIILTAIRDNPCGGIEDLCVRCKSASNSTYAFTSDHQYTLMDVKEGLTKMLDCGYESGEWEANIK